MRKKHPDIVCAECKENTAYFAKDLCKRCYYRLYGREKSRRLTQFIKEVEARLTKVEQLLEIAGKK